MRMTLRGIKEKWSITQILLSAEILCIKSSWLACWVYNFVNPDKRFSEFKTLSKAFLKASFPGYRIGFYCAKTFPPRVLLTGLCTSAVRRRCRFAWWRDAAMLSPCCALPRTVSASCWRSCILFQSHASISYRSNQKNRTASLSQFGLECEPEEHIANSRLCGSASHIFCTWLIWWKTPRSHLHCSIFYFPQQLSTNQIWSVCLI